MKITQEVREFAASRAANSLYPGDAGDHELAKQSEAGDFAAKQNQSADSFLAATPSPLEEEGDSPQASGVRGRLGEAEAEKGMAEMSERFREKGGEIYLPATE